LVLVLVFLFVLDVVVLVLDLGFLSSLFPPSFLLILIVRLVRVLVRMTIKQHFAGY
jgi:hypothetical protein